MQQKPSAVEIEGAGPVGRARRAAMGEDRQVEALRGVIEWVQVGVVEQPPTRRLRET